MKEDLSLSRRKSAKLTIVTIAIAGIFGIVGTIIGAIRYAQLFGVAVNFPMSIGNNSILKVHAYFQIYGFIALFIMGVGYTIIPRLNNTRLRSNSLAYLSVTLFVGGLVWMFVSYITISAFEYIGDLLLLAGSVVTLSLMVPTTGRRKGSDMLRSSDYFVILSPFLLASSLVLFALIDMNVLVPKNSATEEAFFVFTLLGFPLSMVYGIEIRTFMFRNTNLGVRFANASFPIYLLAVATLGLTAFGLGNAVSFGIGAVLFVIGSSFVIIAIGAFRRPLGQNILQRMQQRDKIRYFYFTSCTIVATFWLVVTFATLGVASIQLLSSNVVGFYVDDSLIHSVGVGFIGSTIIAYSPILLPPILTNRLPYKELSLVPVSLLTIGNGLRLIGNFLSSLESSQISFIFAFNGIFILASLASFMYMVHKTVLSDPAIINL
jgi:hypothetical protein